MRQAIEVAEGNLKRLKAEEAQAVRRASAAHRRATTAKVSLRDSQ